MSCSKQCMPPWFIPSPSGKSCFLEVGDERVCLEHQTSNGHIHVVMYSWWSVFVSSAVSWMVTAMASLECWWPLRQSPLNLCVPPQPHTLPRYRPQTHHILVLWFGESHHLRVYLPTVFMLYNCNTQVCANNTFSLLRIISELLSHILLWLIVYTVLGCHGNCACSVMVLPISSCTFCSVFKCWPELHSSVISLFFFFKLTSLLLHIYSQTLKGGLSETRIEKRIVITGDCDIDHDEVSFPERLAWPCYPFQQLGWGVASFWVM